jgi:nitroimidazol reductase NimA-like FMN-containing flavoprotein (pyridoxamine 5'-phosphate oxidase superfamily)
MIQGKVICRSTLTEQSKEFFLMNEPVTTIDPRYSDPNAVATEWEETLRVLETAELFWLSTVRADGRPHVTPVVAVWHDGAIHFSTSTEEQKARNLRGNPHVILTTGCNTWNKGLDVVVEGDAVRITDDSVLKRLASVWATKWDGRWKHEVRDGYFYHYDEDEHQVLPYSILVFKVLPTKIYAHAKGDPFSHTRHQF